MNSTDATLRLLLCYKDVATLAHEHLAERTDGWEGVETLFNDAISELRAGKPFSRHEQNPAGRYIEQIEKMFYSGERGWDNGHENLVGEAVRASRYALTAAVWIIGGHAHPEAEPDAHIADYRVSLMLQHAIILDEHRAHLAADCIEATDETMWAKVREQIMHGRPYTEVVAEAKTRMQP